MHLRILIYVLKKRLPTRRKTLFDSFYAFRGVEKPILRFEVLSDTSETFLFSATKGEASHRR